MPNPWLLLHFISHIFRKPKKIILVSDDANWVLDEEIKTLKKILHKKNIPIEISSSPTHFENSSIYYASVDLFFRDVSKLHYSNHITAAYFHGIDETDNFKTRFNNLKLHHKRLDTLHVTNQSFANQVLQSGILEHKVHVIPIGIDLQLFPPVTNTSRTNQRNALKISSDAFVIGSFQKDGNGFEDYGEPKWEKGPDLLIETLKLIQKKMPNLHVLLTGPARGYVKEELQKNEIPFTHRLVDSYSELSAYYHALDLYLIASRVEGGPKAALEACACNIPLVSTPVGQVPEMVEQGCSINIVNNFNPESLAKHSINMTKISKLDDAKKHITHYAYEQFVDNYTKLLNLNS